MNFLVTNRKTLYVDDPCGDLSFYWSNDGKGWNQVPFSLWEQKLRLEGKRILIWVHGFNNSTDHALLTSSLLQTNLPDYQVVSFIWANKANVLEYEHDREMAKYAAPLLNKLVSLLKNDCDLVAHSMGNWVFQNSQVKVRRFASVAGDINNDVCSFLSPFVEKGRVYFCKLDGALQGSTDLHLKVRLGLEGISGLVPSNFSQIDFTSRMGENRVKEIIDPLTNHSQYFHDPFFYSDLKEFLK